MYQYPVLFRPVSNRESWNETVVISDDDTGDPITLTDNNNNSLYNITLEVLPQRGRGGWTGEWGSPYYDSGSAGEPIVYATLANYITIVDVGTFQWSIPKSVMQTLRSRTYDVYLTIDPINADDGRQLLIGRLPIAFGGRNT